MATTRAEGAPGNRIVLVVLAIAVAVALLVAQQLKNKPPLIDGEGVVWHPAVGLIDPRTQPVRFSFYARYDDRIDVSIVSEQTGRTVATLERDLSVRPFERRYFHWLGAAGARPGFYEVRVHFARLDRTTLVPAISFDLR